MKQKMKRKLLFFAALFVLVGIYVGIVYAAGTATVNLSASVTGLGSANTQLSINFTEGTAIGAAAYYYTTQADINTAEALALGDISSIRGILMICDGNDMAVDCDYNSTNFDPDLYIDEGDAAFFQPAGTTYIMNTTSAEKSAYEYIVYGPK